MRCAKVKLTGGWFTSRDLGSHMLTGGNAMVGKIALFFSKYRKHRFVFKEDIQFPVGKKIYKWPLYHCKYCGVSLYTTPDQVTDLPKDVQYGCSCEKNILSKNW